MAINEGKIVSNVAIVGIFEKRKLKFTESTQL